MKQHDNAMKAAGDAAQKIYNEVADQKTQQARVTEIYEHLMPKPDEYSARFLAMADRYRKIPSPWTRRCGSSRSRCRRSTGGIPGSARRWAGPCRSWLAIMRAIPGSGRSASS